MWIKRGLLPVVAAMTIGATLSGCNLPFATTGEPCAAGGSAQDANWILTCGASGTWEATDVTPAQADALLAATMRQQYCRDHPRAKSCKPAPAPKAPKAPPAPPAPKPTPACDPNYADACVPAGVPDVDCAGGSGNGPYYITGPVRVIGNDHYGLDGNNDGVGCE